MQLLRDNLTLWTSSDNGEPEGVAEAPKEEKPAAEKEADGKADEPAPEQQQQ